MLVTAEQQGNRLTVNVRPNYSTSLKVSKQPKTHAMRGVITHFSRKSRKRMIDLFASFDAKKRAARKPLFLTMTYKENMQDFGRAKRDLKVFIQRLRYHYPTCAGVWRMEQQERGAVHFHLMLFGVGFLPAQEWQKHYNEVIGETANNSLDVQAIRSFRGTMFYAAKYMAKEQEHGDDAGAEESSMDLPIRHNGRKTGTGRHWGYWNKPGLPLGKKRYAERHLHRAAMSKWLDAIDNPHTRLTYSFTVYDDSADSFFDGFLNAGNDPFTRELQAVVSAGKEFARRDLSSYLSGAHDLMRSRRRAIYEYYGFIIE